MIVLFKYMLNKMEMYNIYAIEIFVKISRKN